MNFFIFKKIEEQTQYNNNVNLSIDCFIRKLILNNIPFSRKLFRVIIQKDLRYKNTVLLYLRKIQFYKISLEFNDLFFLYVFPRKYNDNFSVEI